MAGQRREQEVLLRQVDQLWSTLDEMSERNPEAYRRFIRQQLGEGLKQMAAPVPHSCFQTRITEPGDRLLYVNLCGWGRLPAPKSDSEPVPVAGGALEETDDGADPSSVTEVAYSPEVLRRGDEDPLEKEQLIRLAMKYIEDQHGLRLSPSFRLMPGTLQGSVEQLRRRLAGGPERWTSGSGQWAETPGIRLPGEAETPGIRLPGEAETPGIRLPGKPGLIQEISSTDFEPADGVQTPAYELSTVHGENGDARWLELKVGLPGVSSVTECHLSVSEDDLLIEVPGRYQLQLDLPEAISPEAVSARLSSRSRVLSVRMLALAAPARTSDPLMRREPFRQCPGDSNPSGQQPSWDELHGRAEK